MEKVVNKVSGDLFSNLVDHAPTHIGNINSVHNTDFMVSQGILQDCKFDVIIADPPYNIGKDFGQYKDSLPLSEYVDWSVKWINICLERLTKRGLLYVYGFPEIVAHIAVNFPLDKQRWLAWHYTNKNVPSSKFWQRSHETILCMWKADRPALNIDPIREEYTESYKNCIGRTRKSTKGRYSRGEKETVYCGHANGALPRDILKHPALAGGAGRKERVFICNDCAGSLFYPSEIVEHEGHDVEKHPTQKPMQLTERLLMSVQGQQPMKVLVPFAGTGSECVVSQKLGMEFMGFELSAKYADFANQWLRKEREEQEHV